MRTTAATSSITNFRKASIISGIGLLALLFATPASLAGPSGPPSPSPTPFQPFQVEDAGVRGGDYGEFMTASFDVHAGKRLVVEMGTIHVVWEDDDTANFITDAKISTTKPDRTHVDFHLTPTKIGTRPIGPAGYPVAVISQPLQLYCEAGTAALKVSTELQHGLAIFQTYETRLSLSGHLVTVP